MTPKTLFIQKEAPGISVSVDNIISSYKFSTSTSVSLLSLSVGVIVIKLIKCRQSNTY